MPSPESSKEYCLSGSHTHTFCRAVAMGCRYFYFDLDYYGVGLYEEVVMNEYEQKRGEAARRSFGGPARALHELGADENLGPGEGDSYNHKNRNDSQKTHQESQQRKLKEPGSVAGEVPHLLNKRQIKHKFTCRQLRELARVFQETQYPDAQKRKQLAELIDVDECKVKAWFKNKRAKYKKDQETLLRSSKTPGTQDHVCLKMKMEPNSISDLKKTVKNGFVFCQQHQTLAVTMLSFHVHQE